MKNPLANVGTLTAGFSIHPNRSAKAVSTMERTPMISANSSGAKTAQKEPPPILIDLEIVAQMRRRRQMLEALLRWAAGRETAVQR